jgi:hypothetical protein
MTPRTRKLLPAVLVGIAGVIEIAVALSTESQFAAIIGVGLIVAAIVLAMQARKS